MIPELRAMDDVAGGGTVLSLAEQEFGVIAELLDQASYDEPTGRTLHIALAELGQLTGWAAYDAGQQSLALTSNTSTGTKIHRTCTGSDQQRSPPAPGAVCCN